MESMSRARAARDRSTLAFGDGDENKADGAAAATSFPNDRMSVFIRRTKGSASATDRKPPDAKAVKMSAWTETISTKTGSSSGAVTVLGEVSFMTAPER
jgi:hypothetical protein